ncbi:MAG: DUF4071 domain-containing protein [Acetobacteraceae bacterium]|nr:DUF4071 domain-containing protein [Acetobacteraceae bacterium]
MAVSALIEPLRFVLDDPPCQADATSTRKHRDGAGATRTRAQPQRSGQGGRAGAPAPDRGAWAEQRDLWYTRPSSKDRWEKSLKAGQTLLARGLLDKAIDAYLRGFEADWRHAYPGINAVTLMELRGLAGPAPGPVASYCPIRGRAPRCGRRTGLLGCHAA